MPPFWSPAGFIPALIGVTLAYIFDTTWSFESLLLGYAIIMGGAACAKILFDQPSTK
jgi:hypothetical protein